MKRYLVAWFIGLPILLVMLPAALVYFFPLHPEARGFRKSLPRTTRLFISRRSR